METLTQPTPTSAVAFVGLCLAVSAAVSWFHVRYAEGRAATTLAVAGGWLALTWALAASGTLATAAGSPAVAVFPATCALGAIILASVPAGRAVAMHAPLWALVGFQTFRVPLELWLHHEMTRGTIPLQMTWSGQNLDIVAGVVCLIAATLIGLARMPHGTVRAVALAANVAGLALLLNVARIALRSVPGPLQAWPDAPLLLPLTAPYAWIVSVCVAGALWGHIVTFRAIAGRGPLRQ